MELNQKSLKGNKAVKIPAGSLSFKENLALLSKENYVYWNMLNYCDQRLRKLSENKNIDILEYNTLYNQKCSNYEYLFFNGLRSKMREKLYDDQINEFNNNYDNIYHPYNPYLQKYHGQYLRSYQLFD